MKGILGLLRQKLPPEERKEAGESVFFSTAFADHGISADEAIPWEARAVEVGAKRLNADKGASKLQALWARDPHMKRLDRAAMDQLMHFFDFATVVADRELMRQDEYGAHDRAAVGQHGGGPRPAMGRARAPERGAPRRDPGRDGPFSTAASASPTASR
jgi:hypothetical protein